MCVSPIIKQLQTASNKTGKLTQPVPCGKCPECVKAKINSWLFRLQKEMRVSSNPLFVLLTYNDENVPRTETGKMTLCKRDCILFMKRLRKAYAKISDKKIKYYLVGEYGSKRGRPHYHVLLFNLDNPELVLPAWQNGHVSTPALRAINGSFDTGIRYVLKYISKPRGKSSTDKELEFSLISKGMGANYLSDNVRAYHNSDVSKCYITLEGGVKMPLPKYYKEKLYDREMRLKVTRYMQELAHQKQTENIEKLKLTKRQDENILLKNLELSKLHSTFERRNESDIF